MRRFFVLLRKEVRELLTPQILLPFAVTIAMFVLIGQLVGAQGEEASANRRLTLLDSDRSAASELLRSALGDAGFTIDEPTADIETAEEALASPETVLLVVVPEGYGASLDDGRPATVEVHTVVKTFSLMSGRDYAALSEALMAVQQTTTQDALAKRAPGVDPAFVARPIVVEDHVIIGDRQAQVSPTAVMAFISGQTVFVPIVLFIVVMFASQMVATAIATEKENKTLETLLAMPISRQAVVTAKMVAAGLIALVSAAAYMIGMNVYMRGMAQGFGEDAGAMFSAGGDFASQLGLTLGPTEYALLGLSMFAAILVALGMSIILGAFAENVKSVQALITPMMVLLMIPYLMSMFVDVGALAPAGKWAVLAIPFTHAFLAAPNLFLGDTQTVLLGAIYQLAWFLALVAIAARVFSSDRLLTMRLNLSRKKRSPR